MHIDVSTAKKLRQNRVSLILDTEGLINLRLRGWNDQLVGFLRPGADCQAGLEP